MGFSRREFLTAVLGSPFAWAACTKKKNKRSFGGRLLGTSEREGHELLRGAVVSSVGSSLEEQHAKVIIVGGGIAGLSAGWRLIREGIDDFLILELEPRLGGTSAYGVNATCSFPWAAHYICTPTIENRALVRLLDELGVVEKITANGRIVWSETALCRAPQERIFFQGYWYEGLYPIVGASKKDLQEWQEFQETISYWVQWRDSQGKRAFCIPIANCSSSPLVTRLDSLSMAEYMDRKGWSSKRLRWWVEYACRDDYGLNLEETSAWAGLFYFASRQEQGEKPAEFLTWPEGNGRVVAHFQNALQNRIRTNVMATEIENEANSSNVRVRAIDFTSGKAIKYHAKQVICAAPAFVARRLVKSLDQKDQCAWSSFRYTPWVVANISLKQVPKSRGFPLCWDNVLYDSKSLGYVDATFSMDKHHGSTVWTWYFPLCGNDFRAMRRSLFLANWDLWTDAVLADLSRAHFDLEERIDSLDIFKWGHAMVRPETGFVWGAGPKRAKQSQNRLHFAHTDLSGIPLFEEAFDHGVRAAESVMSELGIGFESFRL